jgi:hypothetical protein
VVEGNAMKICQPRRQRAEVMYAVLAWMGNKASAGPSVELRGWSGWLRGTHRGGCADGCVEWAAQQVGCVGLALQHHGSGVPACSKQAWWWWWSDRPAWWWWSDRPAWWWRQTDQRGGGGQTDQRGGGVRQTSVVVVVRQTSVLVASDRLLGPEECRDYRLYHHHG